MMLKELHELYERLIQQGVNLPTSGRSTQKTSFCIVLNDAGELVEISSILLEVVTSTVSKKGVETKKSKMVPHPRLVLGGAKPPGAGINPCFLWDNAAYLLGYVDAEKPAKEKARAQLCFESSRSKHLAAESQINHPAYSAVCRFLEQWDATQAQERLAELGVSKDILASNGLFRLQSSIKQFVHEVPAIEQHWDSHLASMWNGEKEQAAIGQCLITGELAPIAPLHDPAIKGVLGAQTAGAKLVSFNCKSFESYGKEQGINSPVSEKAAFGYCNALNYLLSSTTNRQRLADTTTVFWTDAPDADRDKHHALLVGYSFDAESAAKAQDEDLLRRIKSASERLAQGIPVSDVIEDTETRFFILGLAPNAARLSVRFYQESTMGEILTHVQRHYLDTKIQPRHAKFDDPVIITPFMILRQTVRDIKEMPSQYGSMLIRSILEGTPYPDIIAQAIIRRIKTDFNVNYLRAAFLKAWLIRRHRSHQITPPTIMLDTTNNELGYVLGRLFAALLKTQEDALPGLNRTIRESFYSGASTTPRNVFPRLLRTYTHHLAKLASVGAKINRERLVGEILDRLDGSYPQYLSLEQQSLFSLGFYHQQQQFYTRKEDK